LQQHADTLFEQDDLGDNTLFTNLSWASGDSIEPAPYEEAHDYDPDAFVRVLQNWTRSRRICTVEGGPLDFHPSDATQILRLSRILGRPRGHAIVAGPAGTGKKTLVHLASSLVRCRYELVDGRSNQLQSDIAAMLRRVYETSGIEGKNVVIHVAFANCASTAAIKAIVQLLCRPSIETFSEAERHLLVRKAAAMGNSFDTSLRAMSTAQITTRLLERVHRRIRLVVTVTADPISRTLPLIWQNNPSVRDQMAVLWQRPWCADMLAQTAATELERAASHPETPAPEWNEASGAAELFQLVQQGDDTVRPRHPVAAGLIKKFVAAYTILLGSKTEAYVNRRRKLLTAVDFCQQLAAQQSTLAGTLQQATAQVAELDKLVADEQKLNATIEFMSAEIDRLKIIRSAENARLSKLAAAHRSAVASLQSLSAKSVELLARLTSDPASIAAKLLAGAVAAVQSAGAVVVADTHDVTGCRIIVDAMIAFDPTVASKQCAKRASTVLREVRAVSESEFRDPLRSVHMWLESVSKHVVKKDAVLSSTLGSEVTEMGGLLTRSLAGVDVALAEELATVPSADSFDELSARLQLAKSALASTEAQISLVSHGVDPTVLTEVFHVAQERFSDAANTHSILQPLCTEWREEAGSFAAKLARVRRKCLLAACCQLFFGYYARSDRARLVERWNSALPKSPEVGHGAEADFVWPTSYVELMTRTDNPMPQNIDELLWTDVRPTCSIGHPELIAEAVAKRYANADAAWPWSEGTNRATVGAANRLLGHVKVVAGIEAAIGAEDKGDHSALLVLRLDDPRRWHAMRTVCERSHKLQPSRAAAAGADSDVELPAGERGSWRGEGAGVVSTLLGVGLTWLNDRGCATSGGGGGGGGSDKEPPPSQGGSAATKDLFLSAEAVPAVPQGCTDYYSLVELAWDERIVYNRIFAALMSQQDPDVEDDWKLSLASWQRKRIRRVGLDLALVDELNQATQLLERTKIFGDVVVDRLTLSAAAVVAHSAVHQAVQRKAIPARNVRGAVSNQGELLHETLRKRVAHAAIVHRVFAMYMALTQLSGVCPLYLHDLDQFIGIVTLALQRARLHGKVGGEDAWTAAELGDNMINRAFQTISAGLPPNAYRLLVIGYVLLLQSIEARSAVYAGYPLSFAASSCDIELSRIAWLHLRGADGQALIDPATPPNEPWATAEVWAACQTLFAMRPGFSFRLFYKNSHTGRPILMIHSADVNVVGVTEQLGDRFEKKAPRCRAVPLELVSATSLCKMVTRAMRSGGWVVVHDCHHASKPENAEKLLAAVRLVQIQGQPSSDTELHPSFRLWFAAHDAAVLPPSVVGFCSKFHYGWGLGMRSGLVRRLELVASGDNELAEVVGLVDATVYSNSALLTSLANVGAGGRKPDSNLMLEVVTSPISSAERASSRASAKKIPIADDDNKAWRAPLFLIALTDVVARSKATSVGFVDSNFLTAAHALDVLLRTYGCGRHLWRPLATIMVDNVFVDSTHGDDAECPWFDALADLLLNSKGLASFLTKTGAKDLIDTADLIQYVDVMKLPALPEVELAADGGGSRKQRRALTAGRRLALNQKEPLPQAPVATEAHVGALTEAVVVQSSPNGSQPSEETGSSAVQDAEAVDLRVAKAGADSDGPLRDGHDRPGGTRERAAEEGGRATVSSDNDQNVSPVDASAEEKTDGNGTFDDTTVM
jgi:hypothetical protein